MDTWPRGHNARDASTVQPPAFRPIATCQDCGAALFRRCALCGETEPNHQASACSGPDWCRRVPTLCLRCLERREDNSQ